MCLGGDGGALSLRLSMTSTPGHSPTLSIPGIALGARGRRCRTGAASPTPAGAHRLPHVSGQEWHEQSQPAFALQGRPRRYREQMRCRGRHQSAG
jgi:hypothetical protein